MGCLSNAFKTTNERPAIVIVIINNMAKPVQKPATGPSSSFAISDNDFPFLPHGSKKNDHIMDGSTNYRTNQ